MTCVLEAKYEYHNPRIFNYRFLQGKFGKGSYFEETLAVTKKKFLIYCSSIPTATKLRAKNQVIDYTIKFLQERYLIGILNSRILQIYDHTLKSSIKFGKFYELPPAGTNLLKRAN